MKIQILQFNRNNHVAFLSHGIAYRIIFCVILSLHYITVWLALSSQYDAYVRAAKNLDRSPRYLDGRCASRISSALENA